MSLGAGQKHLLRYTYDFSRDGGGTGAISLVADANSVGDNFIVTDVFVHVEIALTSGGSATITLGNTTDPDGYLADFFALAGSNGASIRAGEVAGALIWDDTNDHKLAYNVGSTAANQNLIATVGTAALTAGKFSVYLEVMPLL